MTARNNACPCGSKQNYSECCERHISGVLPAKTAEALMRSRYTAYVLGNEPYLLASWHESTRPTVLNLAAETGTKWIGLKIVKTQKGLAKDKEGSVEFIARYKVNGKAYKLHEVSQFVKEAGYWYYLGGEHPD